MRSILCFLLLLYPLFGFAKEHRVPIGIDGNVLILSVQNTTQSPFEGVHVAIHSTPEWLVFNTPSFFIESIPAKEHRDAEFEFRVLEVQVGQADSVQFVITDTYGRFLGHRVLRFRTMLLPQETRLDPPYPNPANPGTTIQYALHTPSQIKIEIYNILGQRVRRLFDEEKAAGTFSIPWDGLNDHGLAVSTGTYIVRFIATEKGKNKVQQFSSKIIIQK